MAERWNIDPDDESDERKLIAQINVTPFVDIALVLLFVFMITAPMLVGGAHVDLPRTAGSKLGRAGKPLIITVTADRQFFIREQKLAWVEVPAKLETLRAAEGSAAVYIRADQALPYGDVMRLLGEVNSAGFEQVSLLGKPGNDALGR
jgi:biopolymer transport protein ExbD